MTKYKQSYQSLLGHAQKPHATFFKFYSRRNNFNGKEVGDQQFILHYSNNVKSKLQQLNIY